MGVKPRTIQRRIAALEKVGYVRREKRRGPDGSGRSNIYHLAGLVAHATPFAEEALRLKAKQLKEQRERQARKRAVPEEVNDGEA